MHIHDRDRRPRPAIAEKCWTDEDLEFWLTGDYDMSQESAEVQVMLDLASQLNDARVEWLMKQSRDEISDGHAPSYRPPRHSWDQFARGYRRGFEPSR